MGVEGVGNQGQEQSIIASNYLQTQLIDVLKEAEQEKEQEAIRQEAELSQKSATGKLLDKSKASDVAKDVLVNLVKKMGQNSNMFSAEKLSNDSLKSLKKDYDQIFGSKDESTEDIADLKNFRARIRKAGGGKGRGNTGGQDMGGGKGQNKEGKQELLNKFLATFTKYLSTGGSKDVKEQLAKMEKELILKGMNLDQLQGLKSKMANTVRAQISGKIKDAYLKHVFAEKDSMESLITLQGASAIQDFVIANEALGGADFGNYFGGLKGLNSQIMSDSRAEIQDFAKDELENMTIRSTLGNSKEAKPEDIEKLLKLARASGIDMREFIETLEIKKIDLGLEGIIPPDQNAAMSSGANASDQGQQQQKHDYQYTKDEERDVLINKLRVVYMQRALKGNTIRSVLETGFKVVKLKNGLIKLGIQSEEFMDIQDQGLKLGKHFLLKMLREAFRERATLYKLSGSAFDLNQNKIKGILKNLERLGMKISKYDLDRLRDKCNSEIYEETIGELEAINCVIEAQPMSGLEGKRDKLLKLLARLKEESNIGDKGVSDKALEMIHKQKENLKIIKESA